VNLAGILGGVALAIILAYYELRAQRREEREQLERRRG